MTAPTALTVLGAPELPEGYFYRVKFKTGIIADRVVVQVRSRTPLGGSIHRAERQGLAESWGDPEGVAELAARAHADAFPRDPWCNIRYLHGDHPDLRWSR